MCPAVHLSVHRGHWEGSGVLTWSAQLVLPGGLVVIKRQQQNVHGEDEHPSQEQVEDQVEEQDQTCVWKRTELVLQPMTSLLLLLISFL